MEFNAALDSIIAEAVAKYPGDIRACIGYANEEAQKHRDYKKWLDGLAFEAIQEKVYDKRHTENVQKRKKTGGFREDNLNRTKPGSSRAVRNVNETIYAYFIGGKLLGDLQMKDVLRIESDSLAKAAGQMANAKLMGWIKGTGLLKNEGDTVRKVIKPHVLQANFDRIMGGTCHYKKNDAEDEEDKPENPESEVA